MYSPMSYVSLHLIFFWSHPHSKFQMNEIVFLTTIFHSIHLLLTCSTAGLTDPKAYCVVASPRTSGYTSRTAVSLWWNAGGISTRSRYQAPSNAWWKCLSSDSESSDFFFPLSIASFWEKESLDKKELWATKKKFSLTCRNVFHSETV